jgi:hypothetical protein
LFLSLFLTCFSFFFSYPLESVSRLCLQVFSAASSSPLSFFRSFRSFWLFTLSSSCGK